MPTNKRNIKLTLKEVDSELQEEILATGMTEGMPEELPLAYLWSLKERQNIGYRGMIPQNFQSRLEDILENFNKQYNKKIEDVETPDQEKFDQKKKIMQALQRTHSGAKDLTMADLYHFSQLDPMSKKRLEESGITDEIIEFFISQ